VPADQLMPLIRTEQTHGRPSAEGPRHRSGIAGLEQALGDRQQAIGDRDQRSLDQEQLQLDREIHAGQENSGGDDEQQARQAEARLAQTRRATSQDVLVTLNARATNIKRCWTTNKPTSMIRHPLATRPRRTPSVAAPTSCSPVPTPWKPAPKTPPTAPPTLDVAPTPIERTESNAADR
jgi:hypothetical protein